MSNILMILTLLSGWILLAGSGDALLALSKKWPESWPKLNYPLARTLSALPFFILLMGVEYIQGLGPNLSPLGAILTIGAGWLVWKGWQAADKEERKARTTLETVFLVATIGCFAFFWRNPNIAEGSERSADLAHTVAYLQGATLPPPDPWLAGFAENAYYTFQYYSGSWIGRLHNLGPAQTYFADLILTMAWALTGFAATAYLLSKGRIWITAAVAFGVFCGANFAPLIIPFTHEKYSLANSMRYVGGSLGREDSPLTPFGKSLRDTFYEQATKEKPKAVLNELPIETYAYCTQLGDWHPNVGGFVAFAITLIGAVCARTRRDPREQEAGAMTASIGVLITFITNTWGAPLAAIVVAAFLGPQWLQHTKLKAREIFLAAAAGLATTLFLFPHISQLARNMANGIPANLAFIYSSEEATRTPFLAWLLIAGPAALFCALALGGNLPGKKQRATTPKDSRSQTLGFLEKTPLLEATLAVGLLLALNEIFFVDDVYKGHFERFNTALKWYPLVLIAGTVISAPIALLSRHLSIRIATGVVLALATLPTLKLNIERQVTASPEQRGDWSGAAWLKTRNCKDTYYTLLQYPKGVLLEPENPKKDAFIPRSLGLLTGHTTWLGWPWHQVLWKGRGFKIPHYRRARALEFYGGKMKDPGTWAKENKIDLIVWSPSLYPPDTVTPAEQNEFDPRQAVLEVLMKQDYEWVETKPGPKKEGFWVRRGFPLQ